MTQKEKQARSEFVAARIARRKAARGGLSRREASESRPEPVRPVLSPAEQAVALVNARLAKRAADREAQRALREARRFPV